MNKDTPIIVSGRTLGTYTNEQPDRVCVFKHTTQNGKDKELRITRDNAVDDF